MNIWNNSHVHKESKESKLVKITRRWIIVSLAGRFWERKYAFKDEYVCIDCGYSETFIDEEGLKTIKEYGISTDIDTHTRSYSAE
ncbi:MAG: hypothetical protein RTU30_08710 [Candidatus Thorarchaeota archaeon]